MQKLPSTCPSCGEALVVIRLRCPVCETEVSGQFGPDLFTRLTGREFEFVVRFLQARGNIREMERTWEVSYWSIRAQLGDILVKLGLEADAGWLTEDELGKK